MNKIEVRKSILKVRRSLESNFIVESSSKIIDMFIKTFSDYNSFLLYYDFKNEVRTNVLIEQLLAMGKEVYLPILQNSCELAVGRYRSETVLKRNQYGIMEPQSVYDKSFFDVIVFPGVAFDKECNRLGYGAGYYDRLMMKIHVLKSVGFSFEVQIVDELHSEAHDFPMDYVITERNLYRRTT